MPLRPRHLRPFRQAAAQHIEIPEQARVRVPVDELIDFAAEVFIAHDLPEPRARMSAEALCYGDLTGVPGSGLVGLARTYLPLFEERQVRARAEPLVIADLGAAALMDCRWTLGLWAVSDAMDSAVLRASRYGVGLVSMRGMSAFGLASHHAARALPHGMIGLVLATGGERNPAREGVNPLGMAAPAGAHPAFVFDLDAEALATCRDPATAGLALVVDVLAGLVSGGADHDHDTGLLAVAIAPTALRGADDFYRAASALFGSVLGWDSGTPTRYPGWKEAAHAEECRALGVPLDAYLYRQLCGLADRLSLLRPAVTGQG